VTVFVVGQTSVYTPTPLHKITLAAQAIAHIDCLQWLELGQQQYTLFILHAG